MPELIVAAITFAVAWLWTLAALIAWRRDARSQELRARIARY